MNIDLKGKQAMVTGGSRGIGKGIALKLVEAGAEVAVVATRLSGAEATAAEIKNSGGSAIALEANISRSEDVTRLFKEYFASYGKLDILVNNAGITKDGLMLRMSEADFDDVIDVNLKGTFLCCKEASKPMIKARGGCIINISSVVGLTGNPGQVNYAASKSGVLGLTKSLAKEFAVRNIRVNAIAPGFIQTEMTDALTEAQQTAIIEAIPMKKLGSVDDVAHAVVFLASSHADFITGQTLVVDGGMVM